MKWLKKMWLWFRIRALEASYYGRSEALCLVLDTITRANMELAQVTLFNEIVRLKREYNCL